MKKLLALVLALVMVMSLCITSNAAYSDAADIDFDEAVDVMSAVGVFVGADGKFSPKDELTREQAAKLVAYLDLGEKVAEALPAVKVFNDVAADRWSAKYVAYCADAGYIVGLGDGNFDPAGKLTGYAFGKMLLCALGYDADVELFAGSNWSIKVAALMQSNDIAKGVSGNASAALTREEAAQYCFNALKATCVKYDNNSVIKVGDVEIKQSTKATPVDTGDVDVYPSSADKTLQLLEKLYGDDLVYSDSNDEDDFKRPAHSWEYKKDDVGTYATAADYTFVASKGYTVNSATTLSDALNDQLKITKSSSKLVFTYSSDPAGEKDEMYTNGGSHAFANIKLGNVVEVFLADDSKTDVECVVVTDYTCNQITDVSTSLTKAQKEDGATCKVKINGTYYLDNKIADFNADKFVEDAYVMYVAKGTELIATAFPTEVTGKVTATKGTKAQIDGTYYEKNGKTINANDEGTFYLGLANEVVAMDTSAAKSTDYAYIYNWTYDTKANADGEKKPTITVYYVTVDGVKASAVAKTETSGSTYYLDNGTTGQGMVLGTLSGDTFTKDTSNVSRVVAFSINSDGKFVQKTPKNSIVTTPASAGVSKTDPVVDNSKVATNDTTFVFVYTNTDGEYKTKVVTGYKNVTVTGVMTTVFNSDNEALYTFVAANNNFKTDTNLAVVLDKTPSVSVSDGDTFYTYAVAIDGEETTLTFKDPANLASPYAGMVFGYKMNGDNAEIDADVGTSGYIGDIKATVKGEGYFGNDTDEYLNTTDATVYTITIEFKNEGDKNTYDTTHTALTPESITVSEGATVDVGDPMYYTIKSVSDKTADVVFVVEYVY